MTRVFTRSIDARGRLTLGKGFANSQVIIRLLEDGVMQLIPAKIVPAREAWLYKNPEALASVMRGLQEEGFAEPPDLEADSDWVGDKGEE